MGRRRASPAAATVLFSWVRMLSMKMKVLLAFSTGLSSLVALNFLVKDHGTLFVASEAVHAVGIMVLMYKLTAQRSCSGLSLKSQELTAIFLAVRLYCSFLMEGDIHTVLDFFTLVPTVWVIYMMRFRLKATYIKDLDNMPLYYAVVPAAILALVVHPYAAYLRVNRILWALSAYLESISVLPQLFLMQNAKMIEPFTAHYVFALGICRFLGCAHWILQTYGNGGQYLVLAGKGYLWPPVLMVSEIVHATILADFCYYYIKCCILQTLPSIAIKKL